jgi:uncharacterized membrane protein
MMASDTTNSRLRTTIRESLLAGVGLTIPLIITLAVLAFVLNFVSQALTPVVDGLNFFWPGQLPNIVIEATTLVTLFVLVFLIGFIAEHTSGDWLANGFHAGIERIPAVGSVYMSFRRMSETLIESDTESFQEVKIVEFPSENVYSLGFITSTPPEYIGDEIGEDRVRTVFMPLAPNPVMGGFLIYVPEAHLWDIDMTVEEAIRALVTSGVATTEND